VNFADHIERVCHFHLKLTLYHSVEMLTTERLLLFRDIHWKPSADNTATVSKQTWKVPGFPSSVVSDVLTYQFWKDFKDISYIQYFL